MNEHVGSYEVLRVLARGGMAVVYLARQPTLDRDVALKRLHLDSSDPAIAQRFVREARLAAGLDHPNVVTLFDFFDDDGVAYIAMEYVSGGSLRRLVGRLELPQVFGILEGILAGLAHAEAHGIAHRDLKPENVLITTRGGVKIADFGIARAYNALTSSLTGPDSAIGTPSYMAPEQVLDEPLGPYTDIYAVGVVAYELLAGRPPFEPEGPPLAVLYCHVHKEPPPLKALRPALPDPVCDWVHWLLAKAPSERPASAADAWEAMEEIAVAELGPYWRRSAAITPTSLALPTVVLAPDDHAPPPRTPTTKISRRPRRAALIAAAATVATVGAVGGYVLLDSPAGRGDPDGAATAAKPGTPYDLDDDGRQDLVVGLPGSGAGHAGAVAVRGRNDLAKLITPAAARLGGPYDGDEDFGKSVASGDFDRDGWSDLAASAPGVDVVAIIHGAPDDPLGGRVQRIKTSEVRMEPGAGRYGSRLLASDLNDDGYDDLVIGAPDAEPAAPGSGAIQLMFGGPHGISTDSARVIPRPDSSLSGFGTKLRVGDLDGDGHLDLVEGAPDLVDDEVAGHITTCAGSPKGPRRCKLLERSGTSSLAVADVDGDRLDDILQGDAVAEPGATPAGGEVRLWRADRDGGRDKAVVISQRGNRVPGDDAAGDLFGATVDAGDLDEDGLADIVVAAPGDESGSGAVTVIRGARSGYAQQGNTRFAPGNGLPERLTPGSAVGTTISVMDVSGDERLDVAVFARGARRIADAILVIEGGRGAFVPGERSVVAPLASGPVVPNPRIDRIRLGRAEPQ